MNKTLWHIAEWDEGRGLSVTHNGRYPIVVGKTLWTELPPVLYFQGHHACPSLLEALLYAPAMRSISIQEVVLDGRVASSVQGRIHVAQGRTCISLLPWPKAKSVLNEYVLSMARSVIGLWGAPPSAVEYIDTGRNHDQAREDMVGVRPAYSGVAVYAHDLTRRAIEFPYEKKPAFAVHMAAQRYALAMAYKSQDQKLKYLSEAGEKVFGTRLGEAEDDLAYRITHSHEPAF